MDGLSATGSVIAVIQLTGKLLSYLNDVKDAPKERARCAVEASNFYALLVSLKFKIEEGENGEPWHDAVQKLGAPNGPLDQLKQLLESLVEKVDQQSSRRRLMGVILWKFSKEEVSNLLSRMERLSTFVQIALQSDHQVLSKAIKDDTEQVKSSVYAVERELKSLHIGHNDKQRDAILDWLCPFGGRHADIIKNRESNTGSWFLELPTVKKWLDGRAEEKSMFCPGIPGAGKTIMAAIMIDHISNLESVGVAHYYCNYKLKGEHGLKDVLSALLRQVLKSLPDMPEALESGFQKKSRLSEDELMRIVRPLLLRFPKFFIVIDALDEYSDRIYDTQRLIGKIRELQAGAPVHILATSRHIPDTEVEFKFASKIEIRADEGDVRTYVMGQLGRLPKVVQRSRDIQEQIVNGIAEAVDGMFLLARLKVDSLQDKRTPTQIKSALGKLNKGGKALGQALGVAYGEAIDRIDSQLHGDRTLARTAISWIAHAARPLTTGELGHALSVDKDDTELDEDNIPDIDDVVSVCAGLVTVDEEGGIVRLVHYTTQEYIAQIAASWLPSAHRDMGLVCLAYITFDHFEGGGCMSFQQVKERLSRYILLKYAIQHLHTHLRPNQEEVAPRILKVLRDPSLVNNAIRAIAVATDDDIDSAVNARDKHIAEATHFAAIFGLDSALSILLNYESTSKMPSLIDAIDAADCVGLTPLMYAAFNGFDGVAALLLRKSAASLNWRTRGGYTALIFAAERGHEAVVRLLLKRIDIVADAANYLNETPLYLAACFGHAAIVACLAERPDVDLWSPRGNNLTPLAVAAANGHADAARELLRSRKQSEMETEHDSYQRPLCCAVTSGSVATVRLLLDHGAPLECTDDNGQIPLALAAGSGYEPIVGLLLDRGAEIDHRNSKGETALIAAAAGGHDLVVRILLEQGASPSARCSDNQTPLSRAAMQGFDLVVQLLLDHGADAECADNWGRTPLIHSAKLGHDRAVETLLARGALHGTCDNGGRNALSHAAEHGRIETAELLLKSGAAVDSGDYLGRTPLMYAAWFGNADIVRLLCDRGVAVDSVDKSGRTPLSYAASEFGSRETVEFLLGKGAGTDAADVQGRTPLHYAISHDSREAAKELLRKGASTDIMDTEGVTPLILAGEKRRNAIVGLMRYHVGAKYNEYGYDKTVDDGDRNVAIWLTLTRS